MKWFKEGPSPHQTALAMIGAKSGQRILVIGAGGGPIAAEVALVAGLNGRVLVVDRDAASQAEVDAAAAKAGALVEFERASSLLLPLDPGAFDIAVLHAELSALSPGDALLAVAEAHRILRAGGRIVVLEKTSRPGLLGVFRRGDTELLSPNVVIDLLKASGFLAVRLLADAEGTAYVEGRRA